MSFSLYNNRELSNEKGRLHFYDNAKFILIFLVVATHFISPLTKTIPLCRAIWMTVNTFHMPAFIFISGFFAKSYISSDRRIKVQRTSTYIFVYLAAQVAVTLFEWFVLDDHFRFSILNARSSLWFLQCLIIWHLVLPYVSRFKAAVTIPVTIVLALYVGYETKCTDFMAMSRVFVHFPFFLCGYYCTQETIDKLFKWKVRIPLLCGGAALVAMYILFPKTGVGNLLTSNYAYENISGLEDITFPLYWTARLAFYLAAFILGAAFLSIIPRGKVAYTSLGAQSLSVYILHRFVYLAELHYQWYALFKTEWAAVSVLVGAALVLTLLFSVKPFTIPFKLLQKIKIDKLLRN